MASVHAIIFDEELSDRYVVESLERVTGDCIRDAAGMVESLRSSCDFR